MKIIILLGAIVVPCCLAGVAGCHSRSQSESPPASQQSGDAVETSSPADSALKVTNTASTVDTLPEAQETAKAKPDNPRVGKFAELDTDQDGQLTLAEFGRDRKDKEARKWFERRDADRDGFLSLGEFVPQSASSAGGKQPEEKPSDKSLQAVPSGVNATHE